MSTLKENVWGKSKEERRSRSLVTKLGKFEFQEVGFRNTF